MEIERLNKSQIVLLTLLVSFVTSIATGIVTVSLMEQAPPSISQTVNRVVERTVERIVPEGQQASAAITIEKTIVVKETDLIAKAIASVSPSVVRLYASALDAPGDAKDVFLGMGVVISESGLILTDFASLPGSGSVEVVLDGGRRFPAVLKKSNLMNGLAVLQGATSTDKGAIEWRGAKLANRSQPLGSAVVSISGRSAIRVGSGIITSIQSDDKQIEQILETNIPSGSIVFGSPVVNSESEIAGISTSASRIVSESAFIASPEIIMYTTDSKSEVEPDQEKESDR